jgi:uncharacterized protein YacL (UPF0231 family)
MQETLTMSEDDELERWFKDETKPNDKNIQSVLKTAKKNVGQKDTLMFAFVKIWVTMAELFAPLFANLAIKNSKALNPKQSNAGSESEH